MPSITRHVNTPDSYSQELPGRGTLQDKIYIGFVKVADDVLRMGRLKVWIPELSGDPTDESGWFIVNYCSPFAGATNVYDNKNENSYTGTQKSYGMWFVPPDLNNEVVCCFINGDPGRGIWLGCLYQQSMNHMVPGLPGQDTQNGLPVAEYNKRINQTNLTSPDRPIYSPLADQLVKQGLSEDTVRGITNSGARRDDPVNAVYGILTPGGHQFVFDDNPVNSYIRLRTQEGAQILINDTVGSIYLNSVDGKNWISMDANGRVDIYAYDDVSIRSQGSLNFRADRDVNIEAGQNVNIKARGDVQRTPVANPNAGPEPAGSTPGPTIVVGDSIAVGTGERIQGAVTFATVGDNSTQIWNKVQNQPELKSSTNAIMSVGSNDIVQGQGNATLLTENLGKIRDYLQSQNFIWLLPYDSVAKQTVKTFADSKGDKTLDLSQYPTSDNLHPRNYALVANDAQALCISAPASSADGATGPTGATGPASSPASSPTGPSTPAVGASPTGATGSTQSYVDIVTPFLVEKEGFPRGGKAYWDPPSQRVLVSIGYGHQIKANEYAQGYIDTGPTGRIPVRRASGTSTDPGCGEMNQAAAQQLLRLDVPTYAATVRRILGGGAWDQMGPYQQAALTSVCYNLPAAISTLKNRGIVNFIANGDIQGGASLIENVATTVGGQPNAALQRRRQAEANMYRQRADLLGQAGPTTVGGEAIPGSGESTAASGGLVTEDSNIRYGYIKITSRNSMHLLSGQYLFMTSEKDMHRFSGGSLFDTASSNINRLAGGFIAESANQAYTVTSARGMSFYAPRIDLNGAQPPSATAAVAAEGASDNKQTDAVLNTNGNITSILTDTIVYHLPFHEPYDNHGGRNAENIRDATRINENTGLRDGEVLPNSASPLDIYGTPRGDMPEAVYRGVDYNSQNQPVYQYEAPIGNISFMSAQALSISDEGKQFIRARENGSYVVITVGEPPKKSVGYGHDLTPEEISSNSVTVEGAAASLNLPLTQQQINQLFEEDITKVQNWMKPTLDNVSVTQTQYDMLCSLAFNIGENNFKNSPAIKALKDRDLQKVPNNWMAHTVNGGGHVVPQLVIRRRAEATRFMAGPDVNRINSGNSNDNVSVQEDGSITVAPSPAR